MSSSLVEITDPHRDPYATFRLIDWWDQERLGRARVLVVGAGALGNEVLKNLALLGAGRVLIVDTDRVEVSNLSRSVLYRRSDAGLHKAEIAAQRMRDINPDVATTFVNGDVVRDLGLGVYRRVDVVLGCVDNREARLAINRAAFRAGTPFIDGAIDVLMGSVRTFVPPDSACYECTMTEQDYALLNLRYSCPHIRHEDLITGRLPTTPTSAAIVGGVMVEEAVKLLHGLEVQAGKTFVYNGNSRSSMLVTTQRRDDCGSHETYTDVIELSESVATLTLGSLLSRGATLVGEPVVFLPDQPIVLGFTCPTCDNRELVLRPFEAVVPSAVSCPACGTSRIPSAAARLGPPPEGHDVTLAALGVPRLHVLRLESRSGRRIHVEPSLDERAVLGWTDTCLKSLEVSP